ncbi:hypothetical protein HALLA_06375 [Halostagnicola larsenii XH-48]|uniref:Uncharacterized protein n=1 Tax=Halostagnicola larsenii XH-48 TaxID=797299 RepID=W0JNF2_9EURY|nr:hypothetical protein [Halostagnicola larsenii]AHF98522.1 hypothetical protein HALLA_06375 [Halostagnicola larsenii XH-48]
MTNGTSSESTPDEADPWIELLEDAAAIEGEFQDAGWETLFVEPEAVTPVETDDRVGLRAVVSQDQYTAVEDLVGRDDIAFAAVDVYYQTEGQTTFILAVERDDETEHAVLLPLYYDLPDASSVLETALADGHLFVYLDPADEPAETDEDRWVVFSHDEPSLFVDSVADLEE